MLQRWKSWARHLKKETHALYHAYRDPRVPWYAKLLAIFVVAHTLSPIDLIPDFIPVLGYLDDLIITPLGLALLLKMIPEEVMVEARRKAQISMDAKDPSRLGLIIVLAVWVLALLLVVLWIVKIIQN